MSNFFLLRSTKIKIAFLKARTSNFYYYLTWNKLFIYGTEKNKWKSEKLLSRHTVAYFRLNISSQFHIDQEWFLCERQVTFIFSKNLIRSHFLRFQAIIYHFSLNFLFIIFLCWVIVSFRDLSIFNAQFYSFTLLIVSIGSNRFDKTNSKTKKINGGN